MNPDVPKVEMGSEDVDDDEFAAAFGDLSDEQFDNIDELLLQQSAINAIEDPAERKAAAKQWAKDLKGGD